MFSLCIVTENLIIPVCDVNIVNVNKLQDYKLQDLWPNGWMHQYVYHLVHLGNIVLDGDQAPPNYKKKKKKQIIKQCVIQSEMQHVN